jgi:hypothetical protein
MTIERRRLLKAWAMFGGLIGPAGAADPPYAGPPDPGDPAWEAIGKSARDYLRTESPPTVWPFDVPDASPGTAGGKHVWAHYFPPFPLSLDNRSSDSDTYATDLLSRTGQQGRFYAVGGLLRDRPLPIPPWPSRYWREIDFAVEILRAQAAGLDGFCVDILTLSGPLWDRVETLFAVTDNGAADFRLMLVPDLNAMREAGVEALAAALHRLAAHRSAYHLGDGRLVVAPYNADLRPPEFWSSLVSELKQRGHAVALWPIFLNKPLYDRNHPGLTMPYANWVHPDIGPWTDRNPGDARQRTTSAPVMDGISPQHSAPKSSAFREAQNTELFRTGWQHAIERDLPNVQLVTWNDYAEGTQVSPSLGTQFVIYDLIRYYAAWFKTGKSPRVVRDAIYYCHRRQIIAPETVAAADQTPMHLRGPTQVHNEIEMLAFLPTAATLEIAIAGQTYRQAKPPGLASLRAPAAPGKPVFRIVRAGRVVVEKISDWSISGAFKIENPEYVGGSSTRQFVPGL